MDVVNQKATTIRGLELLEMHSHLKVGVSQIQMNDKVDLTVKLTVKTDPL